MLRWKLTYALAALVLPAWAQPEPTADSSRIDLTKGWLIQSSAKVTDKGDVVSTSKFQSHAWYPSSIPSTVIAALVNNRVYPDPDFGMNLRKIPGTTYNVGMNFANLAMPSDSPFAVPWWYRTEFKLASTLKGKRLWLNFEGINYRANIWLNGRQVATSSQAAGLYRMFEFDVTGIALPGAANVLAVEVIPPTQNDLGLTFVDWNPLPADKDMGLVRDVYILASGPVAMRNVQVVTRVYSPEKARLTLYADLRNPTKQAVEGTLKGTIGGIAISKKVQLAAGESTRVTIAPEDNPQLDIEHPRLWWPYGLGAQDLYRLRMEFESGGVVSDRQDVQFGIREVTSELDAKQRRRFKINGKNILIRGGGWSPDMLMRYDDEREDNEIAYARDMHLNTIRLEGKMMNQHFFDTADRMGMLVMPGWCCCSFWERWKSWKPEDYKLAGDLPANLSSFFAVGEVTQLGEDGRQASA